MSVNSLDYREYKDHSVNSDGEEDAMEQEEEPVEESFANDSNVKVKRSKDEGEYNTDTLGRGWEKLKGDSLRMVERWFSAYLNISTHVHTDDEEGVEVGEDVPVDGENSWMES